VKALDEYVLQMKEISKQFPGVLALDKVNLDLKKGEVLALVGENGAGKSTLMKILAGVFGQDSGEILLKGKKVTGYNPRQAIDMGISIMYQELNYYNDISIAENIFAGQLPLKKGLKLIDYKKLKAEAEKYMREVGLQKDPFLYARYLSVAEKQLVEIAKAISKNIEVLVMDEPTASLNDEEIRTLFSIVKKLAGEGKSIIYISHRLDEIFEISQRVMVMRDGQNVGLVNTADSTKNEIVRMMVGRELKDMYPMADRTRGETVLEVENLSSGISQNVSFHVKSGEIVGLFGLMGSGRTAIVEGIFGKTKMTSGSVRVAGKKANINTPNDAIKLGLGYVPSERKIEGLMMIHTVKENITISSLKRFGKWLIHRGKEKASVRDWIDKVGIKTPSPDTVISSLSGGNQQKVVLAKWMLTDPKVLFMNEPTRGIDVGAKVEVYKLMEGLCDKGLGIVMISSELPEIMAIADRILTVHNGTITGEFDKELYSQEQLLIAALGE
jgi:ABC-type sugar transport system ATPase subunit